MTEDRALRESAQSDDEREALIDRQALLLEVGLALSSELSLPAVLQRIVELATLVTNARYGALGVLDDTDRITAFVTSGLTDEERDAIGSLPVGRGILGVLIDEPKPLRLRDIADDARSVGFPDHHPVMRSFLGAPIRGRGRGFGNIYLTEKQGAAEFSQDDEHALVVLASQAAIAIENARLYDEAQTRRQVLEALRVITDAILRGAKPDETLQIVAERARTLADADVTTISVAADDPGELVVRGAAGQDAMLVGRSFPIEGSVCAAVIDSGRAELVADASIDARVHQPFDDLGEIGSAIFVPVEIAGRPGGALVVANAAGGQPFTLRDLELVGTFARQASIALEYERVQDQLRTLTVIADRERIAKELHDGAIQSLFAVGMSLQGTAALVSDADLSARIATSVDALDTVIRDLRSYIFELRPSVLAGRQVHDAIREIAAEVEERTGLVVVLELDAAVSVRLADRSGDVVHIVREALSNVARHASAQTCRVGLRAEGASAVIEIDDDGRGIEADAAGVGPGGGQGLPNIRSRAAALGGTAQVESAAGEGTTVVVRLPLQA